MMRYMRLLVLIVTCCCAVHLPASAFDQFHGATPIAKLNYDSLMLAATPLENSPEGQEQINPVLRPTEARKTWRRWRDTD